MHFLYEEGGEIKLASLLTDGNANADALQVETLFGKRIKLKAKDVWLKFKDPGVSTIFEKATTLAPDIDMDLLWECAPTQEFQFETIAQEYFGSGIQIEQLIALAIALQAAPIYFRRKGRGYFQRAPEDQLKAALASVERKKAEAILQSEWEAELISGRLPEVMLPLAQQLLFAPDKNGIHYKALNNASQQLGISPAALLIKVGAISSSLMVHQGRFLREYFPKGTSFPPTASVSDQAWKKIAQELPIADVKAFSIDDASTTEIDDAFSVTQITEDRFRIGVHIAAPALAIERNDGLDEIARKRLSTAYFPGGKITMLPESVISIFSLASQADAQGGWVARPALSLYVDVDAQGQLVEGEFDGPITKVESVPMAANLRLHELEHLVTEQTLLNDSDEQLVPFHKELAILWKSAQKFHSLRQKTRMEHGLREEKLGPADANALARDFNFEIKDASNKIVQDTFSDAVSIKDQQWTVEISPRQRGSIIDTIVAEWMIFCNSTWGSLLAKQDVPAIYRAQQGWGAQRTRMQISPCRHEGLGVDNYAWCTSPLRRYADLVNQWQLIALAKNGVMAKLAAPFAPKDTQLMAIAADFDATYSAYAEHQNILERYWCLSWLNQKGFPHRAIARTLKDGQVRLEEIPLRIAVPELAQHARGLKVELEILGVDLLALDVAVRVIEIQADLSEEKNSNSQENGS